MKKILPLLFLIAFLFTTQTANSITIINTNENDISISACENEKYEYENVIKKVSLRDKFKRSPESQIKSFIKKHNKYTESGNYEKLKNLYSESYVNNDGFDKKTVFKMMEEAASAYKNISYTSIVKSINVINEKYASVEMYEKATGETSAPFKGIDENGCVESEINYTDYLIKEDGNWKLISSDVKKEVLKLKYGLAKNIEMEIFAPETIPANTEYDVTIKTNTFSDTMLIGSISNDKIKYPQDNVKDVLHAVKGDELTRVLKSNNENTNEYATASLAITTTAIEDDSVVVKMSGVAILMSRVNILQNKNSLNSKGVME